MVRLIKQCLFTGLAFSASVNSLNCILMNNQECRTRPQIVNTNGDDPVFFLFTIKTNKCSGSCNNIKNQHAKLCVPGTYRTYYF